MECGSCGYSNREGASFCAGCGGRLAPKCASCGAELRPDARFCDACGARVGATTDGSVRDPRSYTPRHLAERILRDRASLEGERRTVTVLFVDAASSVSTGDRLDPEELHRLVQGCTERMIEAVHRFEGTITQFRGDGIMALFGAPIAHEDSARRAVSAALAMRDSLDRYGQEQAARGAPRLDYRIGLNTGPVIVGSIADDLSLDYTAIGDTVNLASRMEQWAPPGKVYVTEQTQRLAAGYFEFRDLGMLEVKGKAELVQAYEAMRELPARTRLDAAMARGLTPYVGREQELSVLLGYFEQAKRGRGQVVFISGEAGIGKSRLLLEFRRALGDDNAGWLEGHCISYGRGMAYHPVVDLLKRLCGVLETDDEATIVARIDDVTSGWDDSARATTPYLRFLLNVDPGDERVATMDPRERRAGIFDALRAALVQETRERPAVVLVEDLHWIDAMSEEMLAALVDVVADARALMILTYRPGYSHALGDRTYYNRLALRNLAPEDTAVMVQGVLQASALPHELDQLIAGRAEGNPFFIEEVIKSLQETGALRRRNGTFELARPVDQISIPETLQDVILTRIDRLEREAREALQLASVIGREFTVRLLQRIADINVGLDGTLAELKSLELIYEKSYFPELAYMFKHAVTHEVALSMMLSDRRRRMHLLVATAIEELYADRLAEHYETLAHHYYEGEDWPKALEYLEKAAAKTAAAFANQDAIELYGKAIDLAGRIPGAASGNLLMELHRGRGRCQQNLGKWGAARDDALRALELGDPADEELHADLLLDHSQASMWLLDTAASRASAQEARQAAGRRGRADLQARAIALLAGAAGADGDLDSALGLFREAVEAASNFERVPVMHQVLQYYTLALYWVADSAAAIEQGVECARTARQLRDIANLMYALPHLGLALASAGRYRDAIAAFEEACEAGRRHNVGTLLARVIAMYGGLHLDLFDYQGAEDRAEEARNLARSLEFPPPLISASIDLVFNFARRGEPGRAHPLVDEISGAITSAAGWHGWLWDLRLAEALAELSLADGRLEEAFERATVAYDKSEAKGRVKYSVASLVTRGQAQARAGRTAEALADLRQAVARAMRAGDPAMLLRAASALVEQSGGAEGVAEAQSAIEAIDGELPPGALADNFHASAPVLLVTRARAQGEAK